jgi:glutamine cyclotransferase
VQHTSLANLLRSTLSALLFVCAAVGCESQSPSEVQWIDYEVLLTLPHDSAAYTQGLLFHNQFLWESTGRYGQSTVRKVDGRTGQVVQRAALDESLFGEGLALVGNELIQLTWQSGMALVYDLDSLRVRRTLRYQGEGWGLCYDGRELVMSNGSDTLYMRNPQSFEVVRALAVTDRGIGLRQLNELECVGDRVYANVYQEDRVVEIDKESGRVLRAIDGSRLRLLSGIPRDADHVLNGIAYDSSTSSFLLTGKLWPHVYVIRLAATAP